MTNSNSDIKAIVCDIEGTTTSISFVYDVLFPYFKARIESLLELLDRDDVATCFEQIKQTMKAKSGQVISNQDVISQLEKWMAQDLKVPELKTLQGIVWRKGYLNGELQGHVYSDVLPAFIRWKQAGLSINIYSSGSVAAQKLLFKHSISGDLSPLIDDYFDTLVGPKQAPDSYTNIAEQLALIPTEILFLSDIEAELDAATQAGLQTMQLIRPGTSPSQHLAHTGHFDTANSFDNIMPTRP